jgi:hypothetical protein
MVILIIPVQTEPPIPVKTEPPIPEQSEPLLKEKVRYHDLTFRQKVSHPEQRICNSWYIVGKTIYHSQ